MLNTLHPNLVNVMQPLTGLPGRKHAHQLDSCCSFVIVADDIRNTIHLSDGVE